jgi:hypothetical protein
LADRSDWHERQTQVQALIDAWQPDWISLQFVPFGYHPKGLPFQLVPTLSALRGQHCWHMMFHEVWVGAFVGAPLKLRTWGTVQRWLIRRLVGILQPQVVHTQARPHQTLLREIGCQAEVLPLFGNIPVAESDGASGHQLIFSGVPVGRMFNISPSPEAFHIGGLFGVIHPEWSINAFAEHWVREATNAGKRPLLVLLGQSGRTVDEVAELALSFPPEVEVRSIGPLPDRQVSLVLQALDFGLATTPWRLREKSGSLAAMRDHGLRVVLTRDDWTLWKRGLQQETSPLDCEQCLLFEAKAPPPLAVLRRGQGSEKLTTIASNFLDSLRSLSAPS